ncbi:DnaD domain protein [Lysinibacillus sp. Y5S-8]|uniref:DnaD domain-containing protein n=1 Tax=Lysinibacillus sp. Y5S-8 TaxID=3122488 RepID=UPI0030CE5430
MTGSTSQQGFGAQTAHIGERICHWLTICTEEMVIHAMKLAVEHNVLRWRYVEKILQNWYSKKIKSMADIAIEQQRFQARKQQMARQQVNRRQEIIPKWFHQRHEEEVLCDQQPTMDFAAERQKILALLESVKSSEYHKGLVDEKSS